MDRRPIGLVQGGPSGRGAPALCLGLLAGIALVAASGCSGQDGPAGTPELASAKAPTRKLRRLASAPPSPRLMEAYFNTADQREWIYDGVRWVPHDPGVDGYDAQEKKGTEATQAAELPRAALTVPFSPTGAHPKHRAYECTTCHLVGGSPCLDPAGLAAAPARPAPAFDAAAKTCASVSCHGAYAGTFTYVRWDYGIEDFETVSVPYAGSGGAAGSWFTPGSTCASCHGNPPDPTRNWHSPYHAPAMASGRKCETCHPDATSAVVGGATVGVSINAAYAALHANGVVNVQAKFTSKCFGCH